MSNRAGTRRNWFFGLGLVAMALVAFAIVLGGGAEERSRVGAASGAGVQSRDRAAISRASDEERDEAAHEVRSSPDPIGRIPAGMSHADRDYEIALRWDSVDLDAVRRAMPENTYWKMGVPSDDPEVRKARAEERARWNEMFGKVLSGTATEAEIDAYYAERYRLSSDYIEFASHLLKEYGEVLPERDVGLLELAVKMHHARLQQMPRRVAEAHARKQKQDRLREAWLADEEAFRQSIGASAKDEPHSDP